MCKMTHCVISTIWCQDGSERCTYLILPSLIRSFPPVPCAPANPQASYTCNSNVVVFSWQPTNNALYYVATSVDSNGMSTECRTTDIMCYFTDAECAQNYTYRVYAVTLQCNTDITEPVIVQTCEYFLSLCCDFSKMWLQKLFVVGCANW